MELLIAGGLALVGLELSDKTNKINSKSNNNRNRDNIYNSSQLTRSVNQLWQSAEKYDRLSKDTARTGIVPSNANRLPNRHAWESNQDDGAGASFDATDNLSDNDSGAAPDWLGTEDKLRNESRLDKSGSFDGGDYTKQFNPIRFDNPKGVVGSNDVANNISGNTMVSSEAGMALTGGWSNYTKNDMTYGVVSPAELKQFKKTQLVPYFAAKTYGGGGDDKRRDGNMKGRLELFTGANELKPSKVEVLPLFNPVKNSGNVFGTPVMTEWETDRYYVSGRRDGEKPFEPIKDTPGLDLDYTTKATGALAPSYDYRPMPKTIDQIRLANKQQVTYTAPVIPGQKGSTRGVQAPVNKYRPYRIAANDHKNLPKNSFINTAPKTREVYNLGKTLREDTHVYHAGTPNAVISSLGDNGSYNLRGKVQETTRIKLDGYDLGPATQKGGGGIRRENHQLYDNKRMETEKTQSIGAAGNQSRGNKAFDPTDIQAPTIRQMTSVDTGAYAARGGGYNQIATQYNDAAKETVRQTLQQQLQLGTAGGAQFHGQSYNPLDVPLTTGRELLENNTYNGAVGNSVGTMPASWNPLAINFKETTMQPQIGVGFAGPDGGWAKTDLILDPTMRQMTANHLPGAPAQSGKMGGYGANPQQSFITNRQITEGTSQLGGTTQGSRQGGYTANPQQMPTTLKELVECTHMIANASQAGQQGGYGANPQQAFNTLRQTMSGTQQIQGAGNAGQYGGYNSNPQQSVNTLRQEYENTSKLNGAGNAGQYGGYNSNPQQSVNTLRQEYENTSKLNGAGNAGQYGGYGANPQQSFDTLRQEYENTCKLNGAGNAGQYGGYNANPQQSINTLRQEYENTNKLNGAGNAGQYGGYGSNPQQSFDTLRQEYENTLQLGGTTPAVGAGGYGANPTVMQPTIRQGTLVERWGGGNNQVDKHVPYISYYQADTADKTLIGRPIAGNINVGYNNDFTQQRLRSSQSNSARLEGGGSANPNYSNGMGNWTRNGTTIPQESVRLDPTMIDQLNNNPYNIPRQYSDNEFGRQEGYSHNQYPDNMPFTQL